jgi:uncharacterized repeat protein (TIGR01451 family)
MKKLNFFVLALLLIVATAGRAQVSFTLTTAPCHNDGVLTATVSGMTSPLTVNWATSGTSGTTITHSGISGSTDALTSYSGGPVSISVTDALGAFAYSYYVGMPPFTYTVATTAAFCPALGSATATVTGGTAPYSYQWFDMGTMATVGTTNPISLPGGAYGVLITDALGCTFGSDVTNDSIMVSYMPPFTFSIATTPAGCTNGTATITGLTGGTAPYTYSWSTAATTSSITGLTMGTYTVTVTDASGCSDYSSTYIPQTITITVPTTPTPATCLASDGAVIAFGSGGVSPYSFVWSNSATTASQTGLSAGYYSVVATDANGCIGSGGAYVSAATPITVTYTTTPSSCTSSTGTATLTATGGTTPYTISWIATPAISGMAPTSLAAGTYPFVITDAVGCVRSGSVAVPPVNIITATFSGTSALCTSATGSLTVAPAGGATPYSYSWSTGGTAATISSVAGGWYTVNITDAVGCHATKYGQVHVYSPLGLGISTTPASCIFTNDGIASVTAFGGTTPYTYSWYGTGSGSTATISSLHYGDYWVGVSDAAGCTANMHTYVNYNASATSCYCTISGTVYYDINNNCTQDPGEPGIENIQIYCSGIGYTYTDASGHYSFKVPSGSYTITQTVLSFYPLSTCQANNIPVTASATSGCVIPVNFANQINPIHDIHVTTWDYSWPVPGHTYYQASVVSNEGTLTESSILAGYQPDGQLFAPTFTPGGIFSGSPYWYTSGSFPTLAPGASQFLLMDYTVPTGIPLGTSVNFKDTAAYTAPISNWLTDYSPWNNVNYFNTTVVSSYDPNFKEVSPKGTGAAGTITYNDSVLEYMVHFQNTGSYQAENIRVVDTIDNNLDWTTLRPVFMSANCKVDLVQSGSYKVATFTFSDINLPPAQYEPITSNGMFTYTIKLRRGLAAGTTFRNNASIYFDYNGPVKTNTTLNTLGTITGISNIDPTGFNSFTIYPNPAGSSFNAVINSDDIANAVINITDIMGKTIASQTVSLQKGKQIVPVAAGELSPGIYLVSFVENGKTQTQKLVIMKQ